MSRLASASINTGINAKATGGTGTQPHALLRVWHAGCRSSWHPAPRGPGLRPALPGLKPPPRTTLLISKRGNAGAVTALRPRRRPRSRSPFLRRGVRPGPAGASATRPRTGGSGGTRLRPRRPGGLHLPRPLSVFSICKTSGIMTRSPSYITAARMIRNNMRFSTVKTQTMTLFT